MTPPNVLFLQNSKSSILVCPAWLIAAAGTKFPRSILPARAGWGVRVGPCYRPEACQESVRRVLVSRPAAAFAESGGDQFGVTRLETVSASNVTSEGPSALTSV